MSSVLIIEDNLLLCKMEQRNISAAFPDVTLRMAHNGQDAVEMARETPPDAIIMDCRLPGCNCLDLLDEISGISPDSPIIIASADPPKDLRRRNYREKIFEIIEKPFETEELVTVLKNAFEKKEASSMRSRRRSTTGATSIEPDVKIPLDRHEMLNALTGILIGIRAFESDLIEESENLPRIRETIAEYMPRLLKMIERATAQLKQAEK